jgi:HEAT repeat protein
MKADTLANYLEDDDAEIRAAAALACGQKETRSHIPKLIKLLADKEVVVLHSAHAALKSLSGKDLGPASESSADRTQAISAWELWWKDQGSK